MRVLTRILLALAVSCLFSCQVAGLDYASPDSWFTFDNGTITGLVGAGWSSKYIWVPDTIGGLSVTAIGEGAFGGATKLESVRLPATTSSLGEQAFCECYNLASIEFPASLTALGQWNQTFWDCYALASFTVDGANPSFTAIDGVLYNKAGTKLLVFPGGKTASVYTISAAVTEIDGNALRNAAGVASYAVEAGNPSFSALDGVLYDYDGDTMIAYPPAKEGAAFSVPPSVTRIEEGFRGATKLVSIEIPASVTYINAWAFWHCRALTSISLLDSVAEIGEWCAFDGCSALTTIRLPSGITSIGYGMFRNCTSLKSFTIGPLISRIGERAFLNCSSLESLSLEAATPPSLPVNALQYCQALSAIYVPAGSLAAYKAAEGWSSFADKIVGR